MFPFIFWWGMLEQFSNKHNTAYKPLYKTEKFKGVGSPTFNWWHEGDEK